MRKFHFKRLKLDISLFSIVFHSFPLFPIGGEMKVGQPTEIEFDNPSNGIRQHCLLSICFLLSLTNTESETNTKDNPMMIQSGLSCLNGIPVTRVSNAMGGSVCWFHKTNFQKSLLIIDAQTLDTNPNLHIL